MRRGETARAMVSDPNVRDRTPLTRAEVGALYERYGYAVWRRCRILMRDDARADDALQEVFVRVMRYGWKLRTMDKKLGFLHRMADRVCFDTIGKRQPLLGGEPVADTPDGYHPTERFQARSEIVRLLHSLDERDRRIAIAYWVDGLTQAAIAELTGFSRVTINKRITAIRTAAHQVREGEPHD